MTVYVSMIDNFMSGWGQAKGKLNVLVFECDNMEEAEIVAENANARSEMRSIKLHANTPEFNKDVYQVQFKNKTNSSRWYLPNSFEEQ